MSEYYVRKGKYAPEVAKFNESSLPIDVYSFNSRGCTCPARTRSCKHSRMIDEWESRGRPVGLVFDDNAEVIWQMEFQMIILDIIAAGAAGFFFGWILVQLGK